MASPFWDRPLQRHNPSFSSSLLDSIYNSIEEEGLCPDSAMKKSSKEDMASFMIDKWMEKKAATEKLNKPMPDFHRNVRDLPVLLNSSSTSSDSSSSESDSTLHGTVRSSSSSSSSSSSCYNNRTLQRPKPIRTGKPTYDRQEQPKKHRQGGFVKTKSRALKIYSDLKQPISPGGRISNFLNSMFSAKKANSDQKYSSKSGNTSTCSSASSFSRSCLSKTPSSDGKSNNGTKRSVRFYPVSVIVDQDCRPCGHKNLHREDPNPTSLIDEQLKLQRVLEEKRRVHEAAMDLLKNYRQSQIQIQIQNDTLKFDQELEDDVDDDASCASSDLFELDNLSSIGVAVDQRYIQELPVYETTHLPTNQRIANGFIP